MATAQRELSELALVLLRQVSWLDDKLPTSRFSWYPMLGRGERNALRALERRNFVSRDKMGVWITKAGRKALAANNT